MTGKLNTRSDVATLFLDLMRPTKQFFSPGHAYLNLGHTGVHYGERIAGMEGFARALWGFAFLWHADNSGLTGEQQEECKEWLDIFRDGIVNGTDPDHEEYWGGFFDRDQKMVEAPAIAVAIALNKDKLWDPLTESQKDKLYHWLNDINNYDVPKSNWRFFRILTDVLLELLDLPWPKERMEEDMAIIENCYLGDGWYCDGGPNQMDYYVAYAIHYDGLLYSLLMKEKDPQRAKAFQERSTKFFYDFVYWFANNGGEIPFGRSLTYRYGHCAPFAAMAFAGLDLPMGVLKNLILRNLEIWMERPIFDNAGALSIGYGYPNLFMSETYNGCGSPYWGNRAFLVLALEENDPFWQAKAEDYPFEKQKFFKYPRMIVTHEDNNHVEAFVTGQYLPNDHGQSAAKYGKYVYSNEFAFSVQRGTSLEMGGFDSTLAFSVKGENRWCSRERVDSFEADEEKLVTRFTPMNGVKVQSTVVPCGAWHVRIHEIENDIAVDIADGGFAYPQKKCTGYKPGASLVVSESGLCVETVTAATNTSLMYNLTEIATAKGTLEPGKHLVVSCVAAEFGKSEEELLAEKPVVKIADREVLIKQADRTFSIKTSTI